MDIWLKRSILLLTDAFLILAFVLLGELVQLSTFLSPVCMFKQVFGIGCAVCGGTHAVVALAGGDLAGAFHYNWFVVVLLFYFAAVLIAAHFRFFTRSPVIKQIFSHMIHYRVVIFFGILAGVYWVLNTMVSILLK